MIQAGGGNTSVKLPDGQMFIKASGMHLTDMNESNGIAKINNVKIKLFFYNGLWTIKSQEMEHASVKGAKNIRRDRATYGKCHL